MCGSFGASNHRKSHQKVYCYLVSVNSRYQHMVPLAHTSDLYSSHTQDKPHKPAACQLHTAFISALEKREREREMSALNELRSIWMDVKVDVVNSRHNHRETREDCKTEAKMTQSKRGFMQNTKRVC